ncbi:MAG: hypothetical protein AAGD05_06800, partial [Bacteroidota bacterium]
FKSQIGLGMWLAAEINRPLNKRLSLTVAPKIQFPFATLTTDEYPIKQSYVPLSLQLGVSYLLNPPKIKKRKRAKR